MYDSMCVTDAACATGQVLAVTSRMTEYDGYMDYGACTAKNCAWATGRYMGYGACTAKNCDCRKRTMSVWPFWDAQSIAVVGQPSVRCS